MSSSSSDESPSSIGASLLVELWAGRRVAAEDEDEAAGAVRRELELGWAYERDWVRALFGEDGLARGDGG